MQIFYLSLEVSKLLHITYESRDERGLPPAERREQIGLMMVGGRQHPIVPVVAEFTWRQRTFPSGDRHKNSLLG